MFSFTVLRRVTRACCKARNGTHNLQALSKMSRGRWSYLLLILHEKFDIRVRQAANVLVFELGASNDCRDTQTSRRPFRHQHELAEQEKARACRTREGTHCEPRACCCSWARSSPSGKAWLVRTERTNGKQPKISSNSGRCGTAMLTDRESPVAGDRQHTQSPRVGREMTAFAPVKRPIPANGCFPCSVALRARLAALHIRETSIQYSSVDIQSQENSEKCTSPANAFSPQQLSKKKHPQRPMGSSLWPCFFPVEW